MDRDEHKLRNKEGLVFKAPADDVLWLGGYSKVERVTKAQMTRKMLEQRSFCYLEFTKANGDTRVMFALVSKIEGNDVYLHDLGTAAEHAAPPV